jgi:hypothetical protein
MTVQRKWSQAADIAVNEAGEQLVRIGDVAARRAKIDCASADVAGNEIVPAVPGKNICVLALCLMAADGVEATFYSGPADTGTALSGPMSLAANGGFVNPAPADPSFHWLETQPGQSLTLLLSAAVQVSGWLVYYEA